MTKLAITQSSLDPTNHVSSKPTMRSSNKFHMISYNYNMVTELKLHFKRILLLIKVYGIGFHLLNQLGFPICFSKLLKTFLTRLCLGV